MLVIVSGLPETGKTTTARKVAIELAAVYLRIDSIEQSIRGCLFPSQVRAIVRIVTSCCCHWRPVPARRHRNDTRRGRRCGYISRLPRDVPRRAHVERRHWGVRPPPEGHVDARERRAQIDSRHIRASSGGRDVVWTVVAPTWTPSY